jgi:tetratricopeptide (TPR) repeat protein
VALIQQPGGPRFAGVLVDSAGRLVLTTAEAVAREKTVEVTFPVWQRGEVMADVSFYKARPGLLLRKQARAAGVVLAVDARRNLALLEVPGLPAGVTEARLAGSLPHPGDPLHAITHPQRLEVLWVHAAAGLRQVGHATLGQTEDGPAPAVLVVQAPLAASEAGGPLLDGRGELVGLLSGKVGPQQQMAFALALEEIRAFLAERQPAALPASAAGWVARGRVMLEARQSDRAVADFTRALRLDSKYAPALAWRARAHLLRGDAGRALADCDTALKLDPDLAVGYAHRALVWCAQGQPRPALTDAEQALKRDPRSALAFAARGLAHLKCGDAARAIADSDEAIWLDRKVVLAHLVRGRAHARRGEHDQAVRAFTQATLLDDREAEAFRRRGEAHWARNDVGAARADYTRALELAPADALALHGRGRVRLAGNDVNSALNDLDQAVRLAPANAAAWLDRGTARLLRGEIRPGVADLVIACRRRPGLLGEALAAVERVAETMRTDKEDPLGCCALCREALPALAPFLAGRRKAKAALAEGLAAAKAETDIRKRAGLLRGLVGTLRGLP